MRAVDCQGLAGAYTLGTVRAGFDLVAKLELPGAFGTANCEANRHLLGYDWESFDGPGAEWPVFDDIRYVFGNPPCSGFSLLNTSRKAAARGASSTINDCMRAFAAYASRTNRGQGPEFAVFECVQQAFGSGRELMQELRATMEANTGRRYRLTHVLMSGASVGAAALRRRYFWVCHREPFGVDIAPRARVATYRDAFYDLLGLENQWEEQSIDRDPSDWLIEFDMLRNDGTVDAHLSMDTPFTKSVAFARWKSVLDYWDNGDIFEKALGKAIDACGEAPGPWERQPDMKNDRFGFQQPIRIKWDEQGRVITGGGLWQFVHPEEDRWLSTRELARVQGFPDTWSFDAASGVKIRQASMWIGKGVPVQSGQWISTWVRNSLEGNPGTITGDEIGADEYLINVTNDFKKFGAE